MTNSSPGAAVTRSSCLSVCCQFPNSQEERRLSSEGGELVRGWRASVGLTQEELAERSGLSVRTIRYFERGRGAARPRLKSVGMLAAALELDDAQTAQLLTAARQSTSISPPHSSAEGSAAASGSTASPARRFDPAATETTTSTGRPQTPAANCPSASTHRAIPAQLPFAIAELFGREEAREILDRRLASWPSSNAPILLAITGMPGVGKTALALDWAKNRAHAFPDGQLHVDLRGFQDSAPMTPAAALRGFLTALGCAADSLPEEAHELSAMYRTVLAERRMLILLDNAQSAEQVRPLLPNSPGSVTIVTSRDRLTGLTVRHGAARVDLDCLSEHASVHLLAKIIGTDRVNAEPEAAAALVSLCGNLPLALHIAGERLARHPNTPICEWVTKLTWKPNRLDTLDIPGDPATSLRSVFSWSYLALPASTSRLFRLLGLSDASEFEVSQIMQVFTEESAVEMHLALLVDSHLLGSPAPGRYRFHKLVHLYARERAEAEERSEYLTAVTRRLRRSRRDEASIGRRGRPREIISSVPGRKDGDHGAVGVDELGCAFGCDQEAVRVGSLIQFIAPQR
ncbi:NB-ARC domain-containing protein [Streptomyces sp. NBC_00868]|nr:NB-ARC domain-containing protein [Streptomyces sp. NBC_00868]